MLIFQELPLPFLWLWQRCLNHSFFEPLSLALLVSAVTALPEESTPPLRYPIPYQPSPLELPSSPQPPTLTSTPTTLLRLPLPSPSPSPSPSPLPRFAHFPFGILKLKPPLVCFIKKQHMQLQHTCKTYSHTHSNTYRTSRMQSRRKKLKLTVKLKKTCSKMLNKKFCYGICGEAHRVCRGGPPHHAAAPSPHSRCWKSVYTKLYARRVRNECAFLPAATPALVLRENMVAETPESTWNQQPKRNLS